MARHNHIYDAYDGDRRCILATVVDLKGSGYRRPGARMLIERDGSYTGAISGGCLERDVVRSAWAMTEDGPATVVFDTRASAFFPAGRYGTGCDGVVKVLLRELPFWPGELDLFAHMKSANEGGESIVVAHVYEGSGAYASAVGTTALWRAGEPFHGANFPPELLGVAAGTASEALESERSIGLAMESEAGRAELLLEFVAAPIDLLVVGAGRDAAALVEVAKPLGWRIRVAACDPLKLTATLFPEVERHVLGSPGQLATLPITTHTRAVLMTHDLAFDTQALPALLGSPARYVGLLGPKRRAARLLEALHAQGRLPSTSSLDKLVAPVGLDLGGDDPWQVGLSIVAQISALANQRVGGPLSERRAPIHAPHEVRSRRVRCGDNEEGR